MRTRYKKKSTRTGKYKSKLEALVASQLGKVAKYEGERIAYVLPKHYTPDFTIIKKDGSKLHLEVKGWLRYEDQAKMRAVKHCNQSLDIRFVFPKDGKVQSSDMLNSEWCDKYDYKYCIGTVPKAWYK